MDINTNDYKGKCRRNNGRLNLSLKDWIWILAIVIPLFVGGIVGWTKMNGKIDAHDEILKEVTPKKIAVMNEKVVTIEKNVGEIKVEQKTIVQDIKIISKTMNEGFIKILTEIKNNR